MVELGEMPTSHQQCYSWRLLVQWLAAVALLSVVFIGFEKQWTDGHQGYTVASFDEPKVIRFPDPAETKFLKRQERYMDACVADTTGQIRDVFLHEPSGLAVCHTPKVGCTFWKRIITYLQTKEKPWKTPFEIDRYSVHHAPTIQISYPYNSKYVTDRISNLTRVVFGRDPYSRLWSAYVDKIILPDSWKDFGLDIYRYRNLGDVKCPLNITFEDFLHYALHRKSNAHWDPLYTVCNPCGFYPKYVGKMETFSSDVAYILNKSGLGYLLTNQDHDRHVEDEISVMTNYFFKVHAHREINQMCLTITALAERLWRAFQLNGYISLSETFPSTIVEKSVTGANFTKANDVVTQIFVQHYRENRIAGNDWKLQRHLVLSNAYKEISLKLREDIRRIYKRDFELFHYEQYPKNIFPEYYI